MTVWRKAPVLPSTVKSCNCLAVLLQFFFFIINGNIIYQLLHGFIQMYTLIL